MLLGYGAKNVWCFKDWLDIDLRLNGYVPENVSSGKNYSLLLGYEGANASGKTNALKVFAFIADFAKNSFFILPNHRFYSIRFLIITIHPNSILNSLPGTDANTVMTPFYIKIMLKKKLFL